MFTLKNVFFFISFISRVCKCVCVFLEMGCQEPSPLYLSEAFEVRGTRVKRTGARTLGIEQCSCHGNRSVGPSCACANLLGCRRGLEVSRLGESF